MAELPSQTDFNQAKRILISRADLLGFQLSPKQVNSFLSHLSLLTLWNSRLNLTSIREPTAVVTLHFLDSLAICPLVSSTGRLLDIGSGAGFPGLPIKLVLAKKEVVLVEPNRKKANFLREVVRRLNLERTQIMEKRLEELNPEGVGLFDEVVTRALGSAEHFLESSFPLLGPKGRSLIMHGPKGRKLLLQLQKLAEDLGFLDARLEELKLPKDYGQRCVLIFSKG